MSLALIVIASALATVVVWHGICALNEMNHATPHGPRIAVVLVTSGAFAEILRGIEGISPSGPELLLLGGLAALVLNNCWRKVCPCMTLPKCDRREPT